ncbi:MAG: 2-hydroxyacid dehydrogenase [Thermocladium sp.]
MKALAILPPFIPIEQIRAAAAQILPELDITTSVDFERNNADVLIVTTFTKVDAELLNKLPNLRFIQVASTGYDNVDLEEVKHRGIMLSNIPVANKEAVAEHVIMFALVLLRNLIQLNSEIKAKQWPILTGARELRGKVFGIIGMGAIGVKLVERLIPFEVGILYYDVRRLPPEKEEFYGIKYALLDDLLRLSDVISIHVPLTNETRHMISEKQLSLMKDGAILINTARAEVIDEKALIKAIKEKGIKVGIDVYETEPPNFNSELFSMDNVVFSPHIAGATMESQERFLMETIANVLRYKQGLEPQYRVI